MMDITAIGEVLIDLTQTGVNEQGVGQFAANPGGAPANVAVAAARLGAKTSFIGCVGKDSFGAGLRETLQKNGVETSQMQEAEDVLTTMAVVSVRQDGERSFSFYRNPGADLMLDRSKIQEEALQDTKILHFGSVSLTADPSRTSTFDAVRDAKEKGALITYDPNFRPALWKDRDDAIVQMRKPLPMVDIIKISDEEMELLTDETTPEKAAEVLLAQGISLALITLGADGVYYSNGKESGHIPGYKVQVADTNGAGDTFFGAFLSRLVKREGLLAGLEKEELEQALRFANKAASLTTSRPGAIPAMPFAEELKNFQ